MNESRTRRNRTHEQDQQHSGADRDRTDDPRLAKPVLSQLSYNPRNRKNKVGLARLELATSALSGLRSNHLSYRPYGNRCADTSFQRPESVSEN